MAKWHYELDLIEFMIELAVLVTITTILTGQNKQAIGAAVSHICHRLVSYMKKMQIEQCHLLKNR